MTKHNQHIDKETADRIKETAVLEDIIRDHTDLRRQGSSLVGECPHCHARKFTFTPSKNIYKCFSGCEKAGSSAIKFLTDLKGMAYPEALHYLADRYNIAIQEPDQASAKKRPAPQQSFRDQQLLSSGIPDSYQKWFLHESESTQVESDRYQKATIDSSWNIIPGDDMVLHYLDLNGQPLQYTNGRGKRQALVRVRWANPDLHRDKHGNAIKYQSPAGSGSHLWIPNAIVTAYKKAEPIETLYICEGEKKADKMCRHDMPSVGIMGINNFSTDGAMPHQFEMLIKKCGVKNVVFLLDSDWQDIKIKGDLPVDQRPKSFFKAVLKFRDYFYAYHQNGIDLRIYFGHGKDQVHKGVDDLLVYQLKRKEKELIEDLESTRKGQKNEGTHVNIYDITEMSTYKLREFWHLHSSPAFLKAHEEKLKTLREFRVGQLRRRWNEDEQKFELAQKILPHEQFWNRIEWEDRSGKTRTKYEFRYDPVLKFLYNRGYGLFQHQKHQYRFVKTDGKVVQQTTPLEIRRFMIDFTREIEEKEVLELLLRGGKQYFGPDNMSNLYERQLKFNESDKDCMYFYFRNSYWKITADEITQRPLAELPGHIWENKIIDFEPDLIGPLATIDRQGDNWEIDFRPEADECDMANFYARTSNFHWKKEQTEATDEKGRPIIVDRGNPEQVTIDDMRLFISNLVAKMLAAGYLLHDYRDYGRMKAIIAMDGVETEVGKSQGGTGKSIWGKQFEHLVPMEIIDGKKKNIEDDNHLYENVDERTSMIVYDDVRVNFNFEFLFSQITTGVTVNPKGEKRYKIDPPKFIVITNHAINGEGNSFRRRQYSISFSDYYNGARTVGDDFGHQLFYEWDRKQWNLFYNWMATCVQAYLKYGLEYRIPGDVLERRQLRQRMGESFLNWASLQFDTTRDQDGRAVGILLNKKIEKTFLTNLYLKSNPNQRKFINPRKIKEKLQLYCQYTGLDFNPPTQGERIKSNGKEYFIVGDEHFQAIEVDQRPIHTEQDLRNAMKPTPF